MSNDMMNLRALFEKTPDANFLREMIGFAAQRLMELDIESRTGAAAGERSPDRINQRNSRQCTCIALAIVTVTGRLGPERWNCESRSCARAATSRAFWSRARWPRKPSPP